MLPPLTPQARDGPIPVSFPQSRLWLVRRLHLVRTVGPEMPFEWQLTGKLDAAALARAFAELSRRHEILRTHFQVVNGMPRQVIAESNEARPDSSGVRLESVDLSHLTAFRQQAALRMLRQQEAFHRFDLASGPLMRVRLITFSDQHHVLLLKTHHIIYDGWSHWVLLRELSALYYTFARGECRSPLPDLPVQYADYAIWQRSWLRGSVVEHELEYWARRLMELPTLQLPTDRARPERASFAGARLAVEIPRQLSSDLRELARRARVTLYMVLLAGFQVLLSRCSGQSRIAVGSPTAGRVHPDTEGLIGFFVNTLVLCADIPADASFQTLLEQTRQVTLDAAAHQHVPLEKLILEFARGRAGAGQPFFQAQLIWQNFPTPQLLLPELTAVPCGGERLTARYDLTLELADLLGRLSGHLSYATDLFEARTIERLRTQLLGLFATIVANPTRRLAELLTDDNFHPRTTGLGTGSR